MKQFMLIEVIEREINTPEFFDTYEKAYKEMEKRFNECDNGCGGDIDAYMAWCENKNHDNCDWKIFELN